MSSVVLSAGVRQNLLSLQSTADLMSLTQNRLATGKKVNSALDNPGNFFTSQSLNNRASDLNSLLDSIGQAQQTLKAADQGITSVTKLVESAKSIAKQARQAPQPTSATYSSVALSGNPTDESFGTSGAGTSITIANSQTYSFEIAAQGTAAITVSYTADASATYAEVVAGLKSAFSTALATRGIDSANADLTAAGTGIQINAVSSDFDFTLANSTSVGLTAAAYTSDSLLDNVAAGTGSTLTFSVNGGASQIVTIGTGLGEVSTLSELKDKINSLGGLTATASNGGLNITLNSSSSQNSLSITSSLTALTTGLGLGWVVGNTYQGTASVSQPNATRTSLQSDYNNIVTQLDTLAADASYGGVNLLAGDDLKVVFNETGTSSLTIAGTTFDAAGLGLDAVTGAGFQSDGDIDTVITKLDTALSSLRTQASKFGSNLSTVQTRQDFTKNLVNTLQTGADNLVLADTNEEGANLLALQTRQQLSTTALSLSAQADQAVLRLFG